MHPELTPAKFSKRNIFKRFISFLLLFVLICSLAAGCENVTETTGPSTTSTPTITPHPSPTLTPTPSPSPIPTPSPSPTPVPPITDPAQLTLILDNIPGYVAGTAKSDGSHSKTLASGMSVRWWTFNGSTLVKNYQSAETIAFGVPETFTDVEGVLTFRGNNYRTAPAWGTADVSNKKLEIVWTEEIGAVSGNDSWWPGAGWTGQPLLVHWPSGTRQVMGLYDAAKQKDLVEVIYPVFDGHVYFLDLETGERTRDPIGVGFAFKGTASVDPRGYPLLYAGQGLNETNGHSGAFYYRIFNLITNEVIYKIPGKDPNAVKSWGAFDSSALINWQTDTLLEPGENGILYKVKLNTDFNPAAGTITIDPEVAKMRFHTSIGSKYGMESSLVGYRNLVYCSDNDGSLICVDVNTLEPVWVFDAKDDSDATMVLEETKDGVFLYHGNTYDKRGKVTGRDGYCQIRKLNALTGEVVWEYEIPVVYESYLNAGCLASPLMGSGEFSDLVIFNVCKTTSHQAGTLVALDKATGKAVWTRELPAYSWSSPIAVQGEDGKSYGVFCDSAGIMHLFNPLTGEDYSTLDIGGNCEASPSAYNNMIVVATYACKIYGIKIS